MCGQRLGVQARRQAMSAILQLAAAAAYAGVVLYHVLVVAKSPLNILYTWHPVGVSLFIFFATASLGRAQSIRGKVAASRQAKEPFVQVCAWLAPLCNVVRMAYSSGTDRERSRATDRPVD